MLKAHHFRKVTSTNTKAREYPPGSVVVADEQTKGKGRFARKWSSAKGGLYVSIVLEPSDRPGLITFIAAIAAQRAVRKISKVDTKLKWPNDLLYDGRKLCGILSESVFSGEKGKMIVGVGLNVNNKLPLSLKTKSTSLKSILKKEISKEKIAKSLLTEFEKIYSEYKHKRYSKIIKEWKKLSHTVGRKIKAVTQQGTFIGEAFDIDTDGSLLLKLENGSKKKIIEGDIFALDN